MRMKLTAHLLPALALLATQAALPAQAALPPGQHGMWVFGQEKIYVHHLPMFSIAPHRAQVLAEVELVRGGKSLNDEFRRLRNPDGRNPEFKNSLNPREKFVLLDRMKEGNTFQADIFNGHFERTVMEGKPPVEASLILPDVTVRVKKILHSHEFTPTDRRGNVFDYLLIGTPKEAFLAHDLLAAPDFDQILAVESEGELKEEHFSRAGVQMIVRFRKPSQTRRAPGKGRHTVLATGRSGPVEAELFRVTEEGGVRRESRVTALKLKLVREVYFEENELFEPPGGGQGH